MDFSSQLRLETSSTSQAISLSCSTYQAATLNVILPSDVRLIACDKADTESNNTVTPSLPKKKQKVREFGRVPTSRQLDLQAKKESQQE